MSVAGATSSLEIDRYGGGRRLMMGCGLAGVALIVITLLGGLLDARTTYFSYLVAFAYWCGLAMAAIVLLMIMHAFKARWVTVVRRPLEVMASTIAIFLLLAIPVVAGMRHLYIWADPPSNVGNELLKLIAHRRPYLNTKFFIIRLVGYFALWIFLAERLYGWSKRQDAAGTLDSLHLTQRQRSLGAGGLPFIALTFSFAAFDWLMSLNLQWYSTIFGVYYFAGSFLGVLSLWSVLTAWGRSKDLYGAHMSIEHTHNIGKLMLSFTAFWAYIGFSQFMLIWIAGLPEEVPFFITRLSRGWAPIGILLILGHFFIPFGLLLSRPRKRDPRRLARVGIWILFIHWVDVYWLVMPTLNPGGFALHWTDLTAFAGVGLVAIAFGVSRLRGQFAVPVHDPYLAESLRYRQP
jgi:hypothetical protein